MTAQEHLTALNEHVGKVIVGKSNQLRLIMSCWLAGGHILIEDCPGTGKTMLARAIAKSTQVEFKRVQFTPDLLPSDVVGTSIYNQKSQTFDFHPGPVFTTILLADEINRATPRTQSALLESMAEGQVTVDGQTRAMDPLFITIATQNPVEQLGTYPLPEAQLDRFMMKIDMGYPSPEEEVEIVRSQNQRHPIHALEAIESRENMLQLRALVPNIRVSDEVLHYVTKIVNATRMSNDLRLGASPRATIALVRAAQALALFDGLDHVRPSHVFQILKPVLSHRLVLKPEARLGGKSTESVLERLIQAVPSPTLSA